MTPRRDDQSADAADDGKDQAFGEHLANQPPASRAKGRSQPDLALARGAARQQQICDIDARHEQHERDSAHQREQGGPQLPDHLLLQPKDHHRPPGIALRFLFLELGINALHLAVGPLERHSLVQAGNRVRIAAPAYRAKLLQRLAEGDQKVGLLPHHRETGRHHTNHRLRPVVCGEGHAEHVSTGEALLPEFVAQHDDRAVAAEVFLGRVRAAERGLDAQRAKDVGGDRQSVNPQRLAVDDDGKAGRPHHAQVIERAGALAPGDEVGRGDHIPDRAAPVGFPDRDDAIGLMVWQRLQHHRAHHAEDRGRRADAEGQRQQRGGGKARRRPQHANAMAEVPHRVFEQRGPNLVARALFEAFHAAEPEHRLASSLVRTHARAAELLRLLIEVKAHLFVEAALERIAPGDRTDPPPPLRDPAHDVSLFVSSERNGARERIQWRPNPGWPRAPD